jgi:release factor glutamine methyltransferase
VDVIARLLAQASQRLRPGGSLLVEIGAAQGQAVAHMAELHFPEAEIRVKQDLAGRDRLLVVQTHTEENR